MKNINVAILGFGLSGSTFHAPLINSISGLNLTHVLSRQVDKINQLYPQVTVVQDIEQILSNPNIDLVVNTLPNPQHYTVTKQCLLAGKHVIVEKPFVTEIIHGEELIDLAHQNNLLLSVYHNRRWDNGFITLKKQLPQLGDIYLCEAYFDRYRPEVNFAKWREQDILGSGVLFDLGSHLIDQALSLFGMPIKIHADLAKQRPNAKSHDYFLLTMIYDNLRVILGSHSVCAAPRPIVAAYGTNGSYVKHGLDPQEAMLRNMLTPSMAEYGIENIEQAGTHTSSYEGILTSTSIPSEKGCYQEYYQKIYDALTSGTNNPVSASEGLNVIRIINAALDSHHQQIVITL